jgi:transposase
MLAGLVPAWSAVHRDLRRPNVTLALLWEEYRAATIDGFGYPCTRAIGIGNGPDG